MECCQNIKYEPSCIEMNKLKKYTNIIFRNITSTEWIVENLDRIIVDSFI